MSETPQCYICFEPTTQLCKCACVDRYAHLECLVKLHAQRRCIKCTVCRKTIGGLQLTKKTYTRPSYNSISFVLSGIILGTALPLSIFMWTIRRWHTIHMAISLMFFACAAIGLVFFARALFCWTVRRRPMLARFVVHTVSAEARVETASTVETAPPVVMVHPFPAEVELERV